MKPIKEFVDEHLQDIQSRQLEGVEPTDHIDWLSMLESGGYICIPSADIITWGNLREAAQWCREQFGREHYYWTGGSFWFERSEDATLFVLRWK
jgi:hypothetical protein